MAKTLGPGIRGGSTCLQKKLTITQASIKDYVKSEIKRIDEEIDEASAFEYIASQQVLTQYDLDDETARGQVGGGNDGGYDGIYIFVNENLVNGENPDSIDVPRKAIVDFHFIQAKTNLRFKRSSFKTGKTLSLISLMKTNLIPFAITKM